MEVNRIARVRQMEAALNEWSSLAQAGEELLDKMEQTMPALEDLVAYYSSPAWMEDFEASEAGELPRDLPQGVLSEDAVYDLLTQLRSLVEQAQQMNLRIARIP